MILLFCFVLKESSSFHGEQQDSNLKELLFDDAVGGLSGVTHLFVLDS